MERFPLSAVNVSKLMYIYFQCGSQLDSRLESALSKFSFLTLTTAGTSSDDAITLNCESGMQVENAANIVATNIFYTTTSLCFNNSIDAEIRPRPFLPAHQCFFQSMCWSKLAWLVFHTKRFFTPCFGCVQRCTLFDIFVV